MALQFISWICLVIICPHLAKGDTDIDEWISPVANIDAAMEGYDPVMSNAFEKPDPGVRNQIFEPFGGASLNGVATLNSFIGKARENLYCDSELTGKTFTNYNQYREEKSSAHTFSVNADVTAKVGFRRFSFKASAGYGRESSNEETRIANFFRETNGEIVESKVQCITHAVSISPFVKPVFTHPFLQALRDLNNAAKNPKTVNASNVFTKFVRTYGTHFMRTTFLGAKLLYKKFFVSKSVDASSENSRRACVANSAYGSIGGRFGKFASTSTSFSVKSSKCSDSSSSNAFFQKNGMSSASVISIGSLPITNLEEWSSSVKESPVPIIFQLDKISKMFVSNWFNTILVTDDNNSNETLNGIKIHQFFESMSTSYCQLILGKHCPVEEKGCGINSFCEPGTTCVDDPNSKLGYRCDIKYGGVVIAGGSGGGSYLSDVETINMRRFPVLPMKVRGLTLSLVGTNLFACGGYVSGKGGSNYCLRLDTSISYPSWKRLSNYIPASILYHTAAVVGFHIWLISNNALYDLNTVNDEFITYNIPFDVSDYMCSVTNSNHRYIIGVGSGYDEIWVNSEASKPGKWRWVAAMPTRRRSHGCLWLDSSIYITGGEVYRKDVEIFNTDTNKMNPTRYLNHGRAYHGMVVLNGRPAVVGGWNSSGVYTNSIETYNVDTNEWETSTETLKKANSVFGVAQLRE